MHPASIEHRNASTSTAGGKHMPRLHAIFALFTVGLFGLVTGPAAAATNRPVTVPFVGAVGGTVTATGPNTFALAGSGVDSVQGAVTYRGTVVVTSAPGVVPLTDVLTETLTASNGDTLMIRCDQVATPIGTTGVLRGTDRWTVVAGTGRYAGANGSGTGVTYIANLHSFVKSFVGTITLG